MFSCSLRFKTFSAEKEERRVYAEKGFHSAFPLRSYVLSVLNLSAQRKKSAEMVFHSANPWRSHVLCVLKLSLLKLNKKNGKE